MVTFIRSRWSALTRSLLAVSPLSMLGGTFAMLMLTLIAACGMPPPTASQDPSTSSDRLRINPALAVTNPPTSYVTIFPTTSPAPTVYGPRSATADPNYTPPPRTPVPTLPRPVIPTAPWSGRPTLTPQPITPQYAPLYPTTSFTPSP